MFDLPAHDMVASITKFSQSSGHGSLAALVVMSHGDELGNICGNDGTSACSVQKVVDAFCQPQLENVTKVL